MTEKLHPQYISNIAARTYACFLNTFPPLNASSMCVGEGVKDHTLKHGQVTSQRSLPWGKLTLLLSATSSQELFIYGWNFVTPLLLQSWNFAWILMFCIMHSLVPYPLIMKSLLTIFITLSIELFYLENSIASYSLQIAK